MNAPGDNQWIETNRHALNGELAWLRQLLENALNRDTNNAVEKPAATSRVLDFLCEQFQLSAFERTLLLLCAGVELDAQIAHLCTGNQDDAHTGHPTFGLALTALPEPHWSAFSPQSPLRYWQLINISDTSRLTTARLSVDERILHYLLGVSALDTRLAGLLHDLPLALPLPPSQLQQAEHLHHAWSNTRERLPLLSLYGKDISGARAVAAHACGLLALHPLLMRAHDIPADAGERALLARLLTRECLLIRGALIIETDDHHEMQLAPLLDQLACPVILLGKPPATVQQRCILMEIRKPLSEEQRDLWRSALNNVAVINNAGIDNTALLSITAHFDFSAEDIAAAAEEARSEAKNSASPQVLWQICRARARGGLESLAQRITPHATWSDLVLPAPQLAILHDTVRQVRHRNTVYQEWGFAGKSERGLGISALFAGESGTGKTLAAEVLAGELGLDLYRIDLSAVVSKYIGETEKNLEQLFAAAETSGAVLLFDEADALFGKRSEVKDSHDRYANIELAYLLQRMESYRGLSILTTNLKSSLDTAFLRRIRFVVQFPFPDVAQRTEIWRNIFPEALPRDALKLDQLARLHVSGGNIRNIAMNAAFFAAEDGMPLSMIHLARAARTEYSKLEKPINEVEMGGWR